MSIHNQDKVFICLGMCCSIEGKYLSLVIMQLVGIVWIV